ncbi:hypothetical protein PEC18_35035 [Paucibacter sp. O1-1]|nr:hypothetical protein [Paucibacter sp. O1-1]MDA3830892.1 hypothetical protein [Paucibacter sp. O1-1]
MGIITVGGRVIATKAVSAVTLPSVISSILPVAVAVNVADLFDRLHAEVEIHRVTHEVAHARGNALPLERPYDEVFGTPVTLLVSSVQLPDGSQVVASVPKARPFADNGVVNVAGLSSTRLGSRHAVQDAALQAEFRRHFVGERLRVARSEHVRRIAHQLGQLPGEIGIDERVAGKSRRAADRTGFSQQRLGGVVRRNIAADGVVALAAWLCESRPIHAQEREIRPQAFRMQRLALARTRPPPCPRRGRLPA